MEAGETEQETLVRESLEETGLSVAPLEKIWESLAVGGSHWLYWWRAKLLDMPDSIKLDEKECASFKWMSCEEIIAHEKVLSTTREFFQYRLAKA